MGVSPVDFRARLGRGGGGEGGGVGGRKGWRGTSFNLLLLRVKYKMFEIFYGSRCQICLENGSRCQICLENVWISVIHGLAANLQARSTFLM
jgi:hypothetical protein